MHLKIQENCSAKCPCSDYDCLESTAASEATTATVPYTITSTSAASLPTGNAVLALSTHYRENKRFYYKPMVVDFEGKSQTFSTICPVLLYTVKVLILIIKHLFLELMEFIKVLLAPRRILIGWHWEWQTTKALTTGCNNDEYSGIFNGLTNLIKDGRSASPTYLNIYWPVVILMLSRSFVHLLSGFRWSISSDVGVILKVFLFE